MKIIISIIFSAATIASAAVLGPALPLGLLSNPTFSSQSSVSTLTPSLLEESSSNISLPSSFKVKFSIGAPLLPVNSTLMNILYFMSLLAALDFTEQTRPRTYSTPRYRDVEISTDPYWTEARFLLWGIYCWAIEMVKYARFNDAMMQIFWEDKVVGNVKIAVKQVLSSADGVGNSTRDVGDILAQTNLTGSGEGITDSKPALGDGTDTDIAPLVLSPLNSSTAISTPPFFAVKFESITGARALDRNEVFLTFYTAVLYVAQFHIDSYMQAFAVTSPSGKMSLHVQKIGNGCQWRKVIAALLYVPKYMMEHGNLGYRETDFIVSLSGKPAYLGTLIGGSTAR